MGLMIEYRAYILNLEGRVAEAVDFLSGMMMLH